MSLSPSQLGIIISVFRVKPCEECNWLSYKFRTRPYLFRIWTCYLEHWKVDNCVCANTSEEDWLEYAMTHFTTFFSWSFWKLFALWPAPSHNPFHHIHCQHKIWQEEQVVKNSTNWNDHILCDYLLCLLSENFPFYPFVL